MFTCALIGYGTVGTGVYRLLGEKKEEIGRRSGVDVSIKWVFDRSFRRIDEFPLAEEVMARDPEVIFNDPDVDCVIELIGGVEPARSYILKAIQSGKHVVTANKAVLSHSGAEIWASAFDHQVAIGFEASVGGGIPVIKTVRESLVANNVSSIVGIMNGTSNYILSRMTKEGSEYGSTLADAQRLGYAEADPTFDVEGFDAAHKLTILAMLTFGQQFSPEDVYTEGITRITPLDIEFAREFGYRIKLLAMGHRAPHGVMLRVHPAMVPESHLLAQVDGAYNAFYFVGDEVGKLILFGMGAGQGPTASAVVADIVDIARMITGKPVSFAPFRPDLTSEERANKIPMIPVTSLVSRYYFRFSALDRPGVLAKIGGVLGEHDISIESVVQKGRGKKDAVPIVMLTHEAQEHNVRAALSIIDSLEITMDKTVVIRLADLSHVG